MAAPRLLIAGAGFLGAEVARRFAAAGWEVTALSASGAADFPNVVACDISQLAEVEKLRALTPEVVIDCVSSKGGGAAQYQRVYLEGARHLVLTFPTARFLYTSSTSVYGQMDGSDVTEDSPAEPARETGRILLATEALILATPGGIVLRLAGLYGRDRSMLLRKIQDGTAGIEGDGARWLNQIHRDDAASAVLHALTQPIPGGLYNVSDDEPLPQAELLRWLATQLRQPIPPTVPISTNRQRPWTNKRVLNHKLRATGWQPQFPSYRDAFLAHGI